MQKLHTRAKVQAWLDKHSIRDYLIDENLGVRAQSIVDLSNRNLTHLPIQFTQVDSNFDVSNNKLTNLEGCPEVVMGYFDCSNNRISNLQSGPKIVYDYFCHRNMLISLEGCPDDVGTFSCFDNRLPSFKGAENMTAIKIVCWNNPGMTLEHIPRTAVAYHLRNQFRELEHMAEPDEYLTLNNQELVAAMERVKFLDKIPEAPSRHSKFKL